MGWFKWWNDTTTDPKFLLIVNMANRAYSKQCKANKTNVKLADVIAVWAAVLECANKQSAVDGERGELVGFNCECIDVQMGFEDGVTQCIIDAMNDKGLLQGESVCNWAKRQTYDSDSRRDYMRDYMRDYRNRKKNERKQNRLRVNAIEEELELELELEKEKEKDIKHMCVPVTRTTLTSGYPDDFESFWEAYPRRVNKKGAFKCWHRYPESEHEAMLQAAQNYAEYCKRQRTDAKYILHASTFLGPTERWQEFRAGLPKEAKTMAEQVGELDMNDPWVKGFRDFYIERGIMQDDSSGLEDVHGAGAGGRRDDVWEASFRECDEDNVLSPDAVRLGAGEESADAVRSDPEA